MVMAPRGLPTNRESNRLCHPRVVADVNLKRRRIDDLGELVQRVRAILEAEAAAVVLDDRGKGAAGSRGSARISRRFGSTPSRDVRAHLARS